MSAAPMNAALSARIDSKRFGSTEVVRDFALTLAPGEVVALVGPSGCGKSTILRALAGLDRDFTGTITRPPGTVLSMVFQEPRLLPWRTVRQNVALALPAAERETDPEVDALLTAVGLAEAADRHPPALSLGMARRAAIARAFVVRPNLLLLDEPFVSLDPETGRRLRELLVNLLEERHCAAVMVTHDAGEAAALADRVIILNAAPARIASIHPLTPPRTQRTGEVVERLRASLPLG